MHRRILAPILTLLLALAPCAPAIAQQGAPIGEDEMSNAVAAESALTALPIAATFLLILIADDLNNSNRFDRDIGSKVFAYIAVPSAAFLAGWYATWPTVAATIDDDGELRSTAPWILPGAIAGLGLSALTTALIVDNIGGVDRDTLDVLTPIANALYAGAALYGMGALIARDDQLQLDFTDPLAIGLGAGGLALGALIGLIPDSRDAHERFLGIPLAVTTPFALFGAPSFTLMIDALNRGADAPRVSTNNAQLGYVGLTASTMLFTLLTLATLELAYPNEDMDDWAQHGVGFHATPTGFVLTW